VVNRENSGRALVFDLVMAAILGVFFGLTLTYNKTARFVPLIIVTPAFALALGRLVYDLQLWWRRRVVSAGSSCAQERPVWRGEVGAALWVILFFGLVYLFGFIVAIPLYILVSMRFRSREPWLLSILVSLGTWAFVYGLFGWFLKVQLFKGIFFRSVGVG